MRSTEFVSKILLTIQNATLNTGEVRRPGLRRNLQNEPQRPQRGHPRNQKEQSRKSFNDAIAAKRAGKSADFINAIDKDSEIKIEVIGHEGQVLEIEAPAGMLEQIVARFRVPAWFWDSLVNDRTSCSV